MIFELTILLQILNSRVTNVRVNNNNIDYRKGDARQMSILSKMGDTWHPMNERYVNA